MLSYIQLEKIVIPLVVETGDADLICSKYVKMKLECDKEYEQNMVIHNHDNMCVQPVYICMKYVYNGIICKSNIMLENTKIIEYEHEYEHSYKLEIDIDSIYKHMRKSYRRYNNFSIYDKFEEGLQLVKNIKSLSKFMKLFSEESL